MDAGKIGALNGFDRLDRQLDGLSQAIRFSDYGASGLFDPVKIGEPELQRLYEFDLSVVNDLAQIEARGRRPAGARRRRSGAGARPAAAGGRGRSTASGGSASR